MRFTLLLFLFLSPMLAFSQKKVAKEVINLRASGADFQEKNIFSFQTADLTSRSQDMEGLSAGTVLKVDFKALESLIKEAPTRLKLSLPMNSRSDIALDLVQHNLFAPGFEVYSGVNPDVPLKYSPGKHYRGMISGDEHSVVSISVFKNEVMGVISSHAGNLVLGKIQNSKEKDHILYYDNNLTRKPDWECGTEDDGIGYTKEQLKPISQGRDVGDCIRVKVEIDDDIVSQKGGTTNATNYVTGLFAVSSTLYLNDGIQLVLSEVLAWPVGTAPYSGSSSSAMLNSFQANTGSFNGDLAHLVSYQASGGIAAGFSGICASNVDNSKCFSSINSSYSNYPTYSWSVMVVTHEMGHLIGSRHTHACVWNNNNTAIDGCSGSTEGSCPLPGNPSGGGTIMSYCHLTSVGINLERGFGEQPGNVVRNTVINASCLSPCGPPSCTDGIQNGNETGVDCGGPDCPACPTCDDGEMNGDELGVDCGGSQCEPCPCTGDNVTLTIVLDNYPEETSWEIRNGNGQTVASGGTYGSEPDGSTVVEVTCLNDGCYDFIIFDSYGDGICCGYGNGSYVLTDAQGGTLASGGSFGSSETTNFCVTSSGPDTEAPSDPTNLSASNVATTSFDLSWNASTDNVGVTGYNVYLDGSNIGSVAGTSATVTGASPNTTYSCYVEAYDAAGNTSGASNVINVTTLDDAQPCDGQGGDADNDGVCGDVDNCPDDANSGQADSDNDGVGNVCDNCPDDANSGQADNDNDGLGNACDNCPDDPNSNQSDIDNDGIGDACDTCTDVDGDQICSDVDCDDNDVNVGAQQQPGTACDDDNPNTENDEIQSDGCTCAGTPIGGPTTIFGHFFETGLDGWVDGGSDCARVGSSRSWEGSYSVRLRDNSNSSRMTLNNVDVSGFSSLDLEFYFYPNSMETGEDFWLLINDGSGWEIEAEFVSGTSFNNNSFYVATVPISSADYDFSSQIDIRFQCDASSNADRVYIDAVTLTGLNNGTGLIAQSTTIEEIKTTFAPDLPTGLTETDDEQEVMVYPNPAEDVLNLDYAGEVQSIRVMSMEGKQMQDVQFFNNNRRIDIGHLPTGMYIIMIEKNGTMIPKKFMKM